MMTWQILVIRGSGENRSTTNQITSATATTMRTVTRALASAGYWVRSIVAAMGVEMTPKGPKFGFRSRIYRNLGDSGRRCWYNLIRLAFGFPAPNPAKPYKVVVRVMPSPTSAAAVANAFLDIQAGDTSNFPPIDQMKLQKLVYYAHAWYLAFNNGQPLFDDDVYAWPWGPVIPPIYGDFRLFGRDPITGRRATELVRTGQGPAEFHIQTPPPPPPHVGDFLKRLWETHKGYTGIQLSNATHAPGEPWSIVKQQYGTLDSKPPIPNDLIYDVFRRKLAGNASAPVAG